MTNRREFLRRLVAAAVLMATSTVGVFELLTNIPNNFPQTRVLLPPNQTASSTIRQSASQSVTQSLARSTTQSRTQTTTRSSTQTIPSGYSYIAPLSALNGRSYAYFDHPTFGTSILVNVGGQWKAFSATCTHQPCTVQFAGSSIQCPCHGGIFDPNNGGVLGGPPPSPLPEYNVLISNGNIYVGGTVIN